MKSEDISEKCPESKQDEAESDLASHLSCLLEGGEAVEEEAEEEEEEDHSSKGNTKSL